MISFKTAAGWGLMALVPNGLSKANDLQPDV